METKKRQRNAAIEEEEEEDTSNLPFELIYTILSKLPVKSLLRFRCVCKPWLSLISDPHFIKSHLSEAIKLDRQRLICSVYQSECFYSVDYETSDNSKEELYFPIKKYRKAKVLCSCNGIILLGLHSDMMYVLWNPSTREYKIFSCPYRPQQLRSSLFGICYDSSVDNYKVVFFLPGGNDFKYFMVYTVETNTWSETRESTFSITNHVQYAVTVSGVPHWLVSLKKGDKLEYLGEMHGGRGGDNDNLLTPTDCPSIASESSSSNNIHNHYDVAVSSYQHNPGARYRILYFDIGEEKFKKVPPPNCICEGNIFGLTIMRGCLSLYLNTSDWRQVDVWVMKEYGQRNSWTKFITIPCKVGSSRLPSPMPMCYTKKGEVVLMHSDAIFLYDPKENKVMNLTRSLRNRYSSRVVSHLDSLVLPTFDKEATA